MVKVIFPQADSSKHELQNFLKKYKIKFSVFASVDELLDLIQENKKLIFETEKEYKKELKNQSSLSTTSVALSSKTPSSTLGSKTSSYGSKSLESPFKKKMELKKLNALGGSGDAHGQMNTDKIVYHQKTQKKLNLASKIVNNTIYVFVSSTFKDMCGERDHLIKNIFPSLNVKAKSKNLQIVPIDLRWGLTKEETTVKGQIELCLRQIDKCQLMVTMLGQRFGWIPQEYKYLEDDVQDDSTTKWLQSIPQGQSITSIEVQYALSKSHEKHSIALLRDSEFQTKVPLLHQNSFHSESDQCAQGVQDLKNILIGHSSCPVMENYPCRYTGVDKEGNPLTGQLELFGQYVFDQIWNVIELEFPNPIQSLESMEQENLYHRTYLDVKATDYFARESIQKKLSDHVFDKTSIDKIGIIYGEPGSGKSSSLAFLTKTLQKNPNVLVLYHFIGCSIKSTDVTNLLYRLTCQLVDGLSLKNIELTDNHEKLRILFGDLLKKGSNNKKVLIVLDGLDELQNTNQAYQMEWLPESPDIGKNIFILMSCDHGKSCWDYIHLRQQIPQTFYLTPLEMQERQLIASKTLEIYSKKLEQKLMDRLISKTHSKFPLFIKLACEELRVSGSFDKLSSFIAKIPDTIDALIISMITRLEQDLGKDLIKKTLCFIATSRFGLLETELIDLLKEKNKPPVPFSVWAPLLHSIDSLLRHNTGSNILTFFHSEINKVIIKKYLPIEKSQIVVQNQMADFYWKQADPEGQKTWLGNQMKSFIELPYHLLKAKRWDLIATILQDLSFIEMKFKNGLGRDLIDNYLSAIAEILAPSLTGERWTGYNFSSVVSVEDFYAFIQYQQHHLLKYPHITAQQAFNLPDDSVCHNVSQKALDSKKLPMIKWINKLQISDFVIQTLAGHEDFVRCSLYKEDGSLIASCSDDKSIRIWNGETGQLVRVFPKGVHTDKVTNLQWRGNTVVTVGRDKKVILWDEFGKVIHQFTGHTQAVWGVSVSPDHKRIVSASWDQTAIVWDVGTQQKVTSLSGHKNKLSACAYSRNGKFIATGCWGGNVIIWDSVNFKQVATVSVSSSTILYMQFSNDEKYLSVSSVDTMTHIIKCANWTKIQSLEGHTEAVISSRFSNDSKFLVSCSDDKTVRIYETQEWTQVSVMTGHSGRIISAAFHPSNSKRRVITCATDKFIKIWDPKLGYAYLNQAHQGHKKSVKFLHYDKSTDRLFSVSDDKTIKVWKEFSRNDLLVEAQTIPLPVEKLSFIDSNTIITISETKTKCIKLFSDDSHQISTITDEFAHSSNVPSFAVSPKDPTLIAFINKGNLVLANTSDVSKETRRYPLAFILVHCEFHSSGEYIACTNNLGFVIFKRNSNNDGKWPVLTSIIVNDPNSSALTPHAFVTNTQHNKSDSVITTGMAWGQNYFALGTSDGYVHVYDIKRCFYLVNKFKAHEFALHGMAFSPNDKYLFTGSLDKQSILWDVENNFKNVSVFPLASISTSNIVFYKDIHDQLSIVISDYTGKIHNLKLLNVTE
ncbi:hypothetical protein DLAC_00037 [Tieghemostelium lacteum]|uniref:WD40 repeat-containing protein n=1 Tax=Tieghemostelium lacteum TaxID=361077 RepID=A0A152A8Z5_TIELA|nr:hypothetical protein DLAC_00037 [Tieghemostelium lacteum]|eukprot:KYR02595.1 hypothetical protein DLAC_00037 [Tieghemostelium lacteum]